MKKLIKSFQQKYDWWIYFRAYKSINRIIKSHAGFGYLFYLYTKQWVEQNPISDDLKKSTEFFFESLNTYEKPIKSI